MKLVIITTHLEHAHSPHWRRIRESQWREIADRLKAGGMMTHHGILENPDALFSDKPKLKPGGCQIASTMTGAQRGPCDSARMLASEW